MADFKYYEKDGKKYERFSTVADSYLERGLVDWELRVGKREAGRVRRRALKVGARVDQLIEEDWRMGRYRMAKSDPYEVRSAMEAWERWKVEYLLVWKDIQGMQEVVLHEDWGVGCTLDIRTGASIIDIKTSKQVSKKYWVQLAVQNRGLGLPETWILDLSKGVGDYEFVRCPKEYGQKYLEQVFVGWLNSFHYFKEEK